MHKRLIAGIFVLIAGIGSAQDRAGSLVQPGSAAAATLGRSTAPQSPGAPNPAPPDPAIRECLFGPDDRGAETAGGRGQAGQFWLRGEYLLWWTRGSHSPPLVTTGLPGTTPLPGALGQAGTRILYGDIDGDNRPRSGGRFTGGFWLDPCQTVGLEASYFFLAPRTTHFDAASDARLGSPLIARPFFDVLTGTQNAQLVAFPALAGGSNILTATGTGLASGEIHASSSSRFQGGDINAFCCLCSGCNYRVQVLGGVRYLQLDEGVAVSETTRVNAALPTGSPFFGGSTIAVSDRIDTRNNFYGGQVGLRGEVRSGPLFLEVQGKVALGVTHQTVDAQGSTTITAPGGATAVTPVGFLTSGSNSGRFSRDRFSVVPEVGVNAGVQVTNNLRAFVGYNFLYWSSVVRPADQIDLGLSGRQIPTDTRFNPSADPARPSGLGRTTGYWAQGISFGAEFRF